MYGEHNAISEWNQMLTLVSDISFSEAYLPHSLLALHCGHVFNTQCLAVAFRKNTSGLSQFFFPLKSRWIVILRNQTHCPLPKYINSAYIKCMFDMCEKNSWTFRRNELHHTTVPYSQGDVMSHHAHHTAETSTF